MSINLMKNQKYYTVRTDLKYNIMIVEPEAYSISLTHMYMNARFLTR